MAKRSSPAPPVRQDLERLGAQIHLCQRLLHVLTGVMIGAFVLILLATTISTGAFVQVAGRGLYFVILAGAGLSVVTWGTRVWLEKRGGGNPGTPDPGSGGVLQRFVREYLSKV